MTVHYIEDVEFGSDLPAFIPDTSRCQRPCRAQTGGCTTDGAAT